MNMREKINKHESEERHVEDRESEAARRDGFDTFRKQEKMHLHQSEDDVEI